MAIGADTKNGVASLDEVKARASDASNKPSNAPITDFMAEADRLVELKDKEALRALYKRAVQHARPQTELDQITLLAAGLN